MTRPFTKKEVKETVFEMSEDSAPGPDGFGVAFYKKCWNIIKGELLEMVEDFHRGGPRHRWA
jgi:hypothetical protein